MSHPSDEGADPWEEVFQIFPPRDAHVMLKVGIEWVQALLIQQKRVNGCWVLRVVWTDHAAWNTRVMQEWVTIDRVRPRVDPWSMGA